jgi:ATP-dependent DNA ligase
LVLWDQKSEQILPFDDLYKYMHLGHRYKHHHFKVDGRQHDRKLNAMAVIFDVMLVDEHNLLHKSYIGRMTLLSHMITTSPGRVSPTPGPAIDKQAMFPKRFHLPLEPLDTAVEALRKKFSDATNDRDEGFVLKPDNSPYLGLPTWFKLKKDYIPGHGDLIDCCIVGGGFDPERARQSSARLPRGVKWNVWHIGFLENKEEVIQHVTPLPSVLVGLYWHMLTGGRMHDQSLWLYSWPVLN